MDLDKEYGKALPPSKIKPWEENEEGGVVSNPTTQIFDSSDSSKGGLDLSMDMKMYIWVVDKAGCLRVGEECVVGVDLHSGQEKKLGHPTLVKGEPARIAGEITWFENEKKWKVNDISGRYTKNRNRSRAHLDHVVQLFIRAGIQAEIDRVVYSNA